MNPSLYISISEYLMGREVAYPLTDTTLGNASKLLMQVNKLMDKFYQAYPESKRKGCSSGYRPAAVNKNVVGAAKASAHMTCEAIDIADSSRELCNWVFSNQQVLKDLDLYMEAMESTPKWIHLSTRKPNSGKRIFKP